MVLGLGNPGPDYQFTRHNAGFWFLDHWAGRLDLPFRKAWFRPYFFVESQRGPDHLVLVKPLTFMNLSGDVVPGVLSRFQATPDDLLVVFDQMDLAPGRLRLKPKGSHAGHNGLRSIDAALGGDHYHRLAVGIGRPPVGHSVVDHVLGRPSEADGEAIVHSLERGVALVDGLWNQGWEPLINAINQRDNRSTPVPQ